ncbi:hypothetical protein UlMin_018084 [Ulmus minor]
MSASKPSQGGAASEAGKRNLPSWMNKSESDGKKPTGVPENEESNQVEKPKKAKAQSAKEVGNSKKSSANFSKLLDGVVFVLSGFVNPERSILRSQALEMGAEYQPDWNSDCTLLVCAFPNTPKFRQVEADGGTIISKDWISECYSQKKLVDIEIYVKHAGKPWRRSEVPHETRKASPPSKPQKHDRGSHSKVTPSANSKNKVSNPAKALFSPSKVKKWAIEDLNNTVSWLESQEEKPEPSEIKKIAAEGILTCLQDAIDSLKQKQDIGKVTEEWNFIPHVVEELARLETSNENTTTISKEDLCREAMECKRIYEMEFDGSEDDTSAKMKKQKMDEQKRDGKGYDSDETVEMTEEEIELAYNTVSSKFHKH